LTEHRKNPERIICNRAHGIKTDENHKLLPYNNWDYCIKPETYFENGKNSHFSVFPTVVGWILYPPKCFYKDITNKELFMTLAPQADDIWLWAMAIINEKFANENPYVVVENGDKGLKFVGSSKSQKETGSALHHYNVLQNGNDKQLAAVIKHYPQIMKILQKI
jgi:hypothetical protein